MKKLLGISANERNVSLITSSLAEHGLILVKRIDTVQGEIWKLYIISKSEYSNFTFAEFVLFYDLTISHVIGTINISEFNKIQQILSECYAIITERDREELNNE